jgi:sulfite reductase (NADPH) flavoprotein alpha-component
MKRYFETHVEEANFAGTPWQADVGTARTGSPQTAPVLILYGTVSGNAEYLAKQLAMQLRGRGVAPLVRDMAQSDPAMLTQARCVLLVVSTYGEGGPPQDTEAFWEAVVRGNCLDLRGLKFSVLALGNSTFDQFCQCGRDFDTALERQGATRLYPRVDCDVYYEAPAQEWMDGVLMCLEETSISAIAA